ncbi:hypothetical protein HFP89_05770 [Wenzhouxiangella sp. XN79A]|uniref:hypothetical protein n=1 Tax=Wenzhouxiangella sp. XN79A TaxID=2724193 RepID=UPI00144AD17C|nr:hypothetical protein [Wenzhouxiangella sp. XN79A]NKI34668.1 hypothetical protein [Wenzhouxiangella sp. XN79A]
MSRSIARAPTHLRAVGSVSLLWNAVGAFGYLATRLGLESWMDKYSDAQQAFFDGYPAWAVSCWALGVWGAAFGSIALLLRSRLAVVLFAVSLIGLIGSSVHSFLLSDGVALMGSSGAVFSAVIVIVAVGLLVYARRMSAAGVLR